MTKKESGNIQKRPEPLENAPMRYAPENELGVVFLFSQIAKKKGLKIDQIRPTFPDCIAYRQTRDGEKRIRIEFEYQSRNFRTHGHSARKCDMLVCWEHNWPSVPSGLEVLELRREFGLGFNVWIMPVGGLFKEELSRLNSNSAWTVPSRASKGDLLLYYHTRPDKCIKDIFRLTGSVKLQRVQSSWNKRKRDYMGPIRRVCKLKSPVFLEDLQNDRILSTASFVRASMQGRPRVTEYWPYLYDMIIRRNSNAKGKLSRYSPDRI